MDKKRKFSVCSGFLGAGKTTAMLAVANYLEKTGCKTALICNDLGDGNLVDGLYTAENCRCSCTIAGGCICYNTETLVDKIRRFTDEQGAGLVISDIPGCGVGALDHVYFKLAREYPGEFDLAPFTVVCDPLRLHAIMPGKERPRLPEEMDYLFRTQLLEADAIVFNKTDTVSQEEREECIAFLKETFPGVPVFATSAKTDEGIPALAEHMRAASARLTEIDTGYGGPAFMAAEEKLSWYDRRFTLTADAPFDANEAARFYMETAARLFIEADRNVPHLKLFAMGRENDYLKLSLIDAYAPLSIDREAKHPAGSFTFYVNARAAAESEKTAALLESTLQQTAAHCGAAYEIKETEYFGMTDD